MLAVQQYSFDRAPTICAPRRGTSRPSQSGSTWLALANLAVTFSNKGEGSVTGEPIREEHRNRTTGRARRAGSSASATG